MADLPEKKTRKTQERDPKMVCGAKTRRGGKCQVFAMANGRCRIHGGMSVGAPIGNQNAAKHGVYRCHLTPEEQRDYDALELGNVEHELRLTRIRLGRALQAEAAAKGKPELASEVYNRGSARMSVPEYTATYSVRDYTKLVDQLTARVESLERTRLNLLAATGGGEDDMGQQDTFIAPDEQVPDAPIL